MQIMPPLGQYDSDKAVNIGSHRWAFKPEIGVSKALGPLALELAPSITFYIDNDEFLGDKVRKQDPIYSVQRHAVYRFGNALWAPWTAPTTVAERRPSTERRTTIDSPTPGSA